MAAVDHTVAWAALGSPSPSISYYLVRCSLVVSHSFEWNFIDRKGAAAPHKI